MAGVLAAYYRRSFSIGNDSLEPNRGIGFAQTKGEANALVACCGLLDGCGAAGLHGDLCPHQREEILAQLRSGRSQVLVATDVATLDPNISGMELVVKYQVPQDLESYIHCVGRPGRACESGTARVLFRDGELNCVGCGT